MEHCNRKSVTDSLKKYDCLAKDSDFIEVTEWHNGEGWDISINDNKLISLTWGQLEAISYLVKSLDYNKQ
jgi:hypothetical protein